MAEHILEIELANALARNAELERQLAEAKKTIEGLTGATSKKVTGEIPQMAPSDDNYENFGTGSPADIDTKTPIH